ncbi:MAG: hypothetical protein KatS3mg057_2688 [Herpetosiphonaceae bacterium]|nr:MAG: hypothetical protein KatS3mg057_2688 [Herpetosiphonaceae bacterium]
MKLVRWLFLAHLVALLFGLSGLLIALPHPELWADSPQAGRVFVFGMRYAGSLHILLGLAVMLALGLRFVGRRKTLIFLGLAVSLSLGSELIGTGTGWPFGNYAYTDGLGTKVLGRVPYTIPLSWFYMGFASYLLAAAIARGRWRSSWPTLLLGVWFLTVWDLVLDPAMAHESLPIKFWVWYEQGSYFGMPIKNFAGWSLTGLAFMGLSRQLWRSEASLDRRVRWVPFGVYIANMIFASALSLSVGLWQPVLIAALLGGLPALLALVDRADTGGTADQNDREEGGIARRVLRAGAGSIASRKIEIAVEGLEHLPQRGPALIVSRHYHHLYDGCILLAKLPQPVSILVGLDWIRSRWTRWLMEWACRSAGWPIILRPEALQNRDTARRSAYQPEEVRRYLRRGIAEAVEALCRGHLLVIFAEGYPAIDPHASARRDEQRMLPFRPGFARILALAERRLGAGIPVIPAGLSYQRGRRWRAVLRLGRPIYLNQQSTAAFVHSVEQQVRRLSAAHAEEQVLAARSAQL